MPILRIRDENGVVHGVRALKGEKGDSAVARIGSYVGNADEREWVSQYINLGSPHIGAVLVADGSGRTYLVTKDGIQNSDGVNKAALMYIPTMHETNLFLAVYRTEDEEEPQLNKKDVTYHYVAFVEEASA